MVGCTMRRSISSWLTLVRLVTSLEGTQSLRLDPLNASVVILATPCSVTTSKQGLTDGWQQMYGSSPEKRDGCLT